MKQTNRTEKEYRELLNELSQKVGMRNYDLFVNFMVNRFPNEISISYIREWAFRFMSGNPTSYMDSESLDIYKELIKSIKGINMTYPPSYYV
tara:strand:+ start:1005 stop:1280 length:276 start_codon:yes stop_codon:yes gene_type:complete